MRAPTALNGYLVFLIHSIRNTRHAVIYPEAERYALADGVEALPLSALADPGFSWPAAQELNVASLARDVGINGETLRSYLALLETIYLHVRLPAWSTNFTSRAKHHPKVHMVDTGLAANVLGLSAERLSTPTTQMAGPLFETFVVNELVRQQAWSDERVRLGHFRDREQREVDLILESGDGRVVAVEMKAARDVDEIDFRWLAYLRDRLGDLFINGIVIHLGERPLPFGDRLTALPVSAVWS